VAIPQQRGGALAGREWGEGIWAIRPGRGRGGVLSFYFFYFYFFYSKAIFKTVLKITLNYV